MRILLAVDGSTPSDAAVAEVAARPWPANSTVRILCVAASVLPATPLGWYAPGVDLEELQKREQAQAEAVVNRAAEQLRSKGLTVETKVLTGHARGAIIEESEQWPADLIVMGSHGHTGMRRLLLGSVANHVVAHAPCSVYIVRRVMDEDDRAAGSRSSGGARN